MVGSVPPVCRIHFYDPALENGISLVTKSIGPRVSSSPVASNIPRKLGKRWEKGGWRNFVVGKNENEQMKEKGDSA